jgi:putative ABC transport system ATP-binding protein
VGERDGARPSAVQLNDVRRTFGRGNGAVEALRGVSVSFERGSFTAVMGPSGSGKSTFLQCAAGLDAPTSGNVVLDGVDLTGMKETALTRLRRDRVGFVFQGFNLMPALTVEQNVTLPLRLARRRADRGRLAEVISRVGLSERIHHLPSELSGGQQQRVAIARALITSPAVLFADEPTGALDTKTTGEVLELLRESVREAGQTIVMVTHDPVAAAHADRVIFLADGQLAGQMDYPSPAAVAEYVTRLGEWAARQPVPARRGKGS